MVSIICPSRDRPNNLKIAFDSLGLQKNGLEALAWIDEDDPQMDKYIELFGEDPAVKLFIKKHVGYGNFHVMINFLTAQAKYNWIFLFNDDAYIENPGWFRKFSDFVRKFEPTASPIVINIWGQGDAKFNLFPIVSRKFVDILGHFSLFYACDTWVQTVAVGAGIHYSLNGLKPVHRKYQREDVLRDKTFEETERVRNVIKYTDNPDRSPFKQLLAEDIRKIIEFKKSINYGG